MIGIYMIKNKVNGMIYVGESVDIERRWNEHKTDLTNNSHHSWKLQRDWNKYGEDVFEFNVLKEIIKYSNHLRLAAFLIILEDKYITKFNSINNGYNVENTYLKIKNKDKAILGKLKNSKLYAVFEMVDKKINLANIICPCGYIRYEEYKNTYHGTHKEYNKTKARIIRELCNDISFKDFNMATVLSKNKFDNQYLDNMIHINNGFVFINKTYLKEVLKRWIEDNFTFKD